MTIEEAQTILGIGLELIAVGFFIHGWFWRSTHSMATAAVVFLIAQ